MEHARGLAEALVGPDQNSARLRVLARGIATCETQRALLEAMLMERLARRDGEGVDLIERVLGNLTARVSKLIEAHRQESLVQQRPVLVAVGHADEVNIGAIEDEPVALYRDEVLRVGLPQLKAKWRPRIFKTLKAVRLEHNGFTADVQLVRKAIIGIPAGWRRYLQCPRCGALGDVVGCVPLGHGVEPGWACPKCARWRGRPSRLAS